MSSPAENVIFWGNVQPDIVLIRVKGRASYLNSHVFSDFVVKMLRENHFSFCFFLEECMGMDSTFLGIIAGLAIEVQRHNGVCNLYSLRPKQLESVYKLGLYNLDQIVENVADEKRWQNTNEFAIQEQQTTGEDTRKIMLKAHTTLMQLSQQNTVRFQNVVQFLRVAH